ncbi:MAG: hypothetical protein AAAFM81_15035 [Pseudomonadota bacterium]
MQPEIRLATTAEDLRACRRFWYDVYVLEMGRHTESESIVDHELSELCDPNDQTADVFMAISGDDVVGTLQSAYSRSSDLRSYEELYGLADRDAADFLGISVTSKLMIAPELRATGLAYRLGVATYLKGLRDGIRENYIDTNEHLIEFYSRLGYREHLGWITHPAYGRVYSMVINLLDGKHLKRCKSPLLRHLNSYNQLATTNGERNNEQVA